MDAFTDLSLDTPQPDKSLPTIIEPLTQDRLRRKLPSETTGVLTSVEAFASPVDGPSPNASKPLEDETSTPVQSSPNHINAKNSTPTDIVSDLASSDLGTPSQPFKSEVCKPVQPSPNHFNVNKNTAAEIAAGLGFPNINATSSQSKGPVSVLRRKEAERAKAAMSRPKKMPGGGKSK